MKEEKLTKEELTTLIRDMEHDIEDMQRKLKGLYADLQSSSNVRVKRYRRC